MTRQVRVQGNSDPRINQWIARRVGEGRGELGARAEAVCRVLGDGKMVRVRRVEAGSWSDRLLGRPAAVWVEKIRGAVSTSVGVDSAKKGTVKGKVELPNLLSGLLGLNVLSLEGSLGQVKGSLVLGELDLEQTGNPVTYKWKAEGELGAAGKRVALTHSTPGLLAASRASVGAEVRGGAGVLETLATAEKKLLWGSGRWSGRVEAGRATPAAQAGHSYALGRVWCQQVLPLIGLAPETVGRQLARLGVASAGGSAGLAVDGRIELEGRAVSAGGVGTGAGGRLSGSAQGAVSLRALFERFGAFAGIAAGQVVRAEPPERWWSPVFGVFYSPGKGWLDTIDLQWTVREVAAAAGISKKLGTVAVTVTKTM